MCRFSSYFFRLPFLPRIAHPHTSILLPVVIHRQAFFNAAAAIGDLGEVVFTCGFLRSAEGAVISGGGVQISALQAAPQEFAVALGAEGRAHHVGSGGGKVGMAVDAITMAPKLDAVILATGDGDFVPLVEYLQRNAGCQVEVISFGRSTSSMLKEAADDFIDMDADPKKFLLNFRPVRGGAGTPRRFNNNRPPRGNEPLDADTPATPAFVPQSQTQKEIEQAAIDSGEPLA